MQLLASGRRKFPHTPGVTRKGSGSARWQGPCIAKGSGSARWQGPRIAKHLVFGSQDSAISLMFIRHFVTLQFSGGVQMEQGRVEKMQTKTGEHYKTSWERTGLKVRVL